MIVLIWCWKTNNRMSERVSRLLSDLLNRRLLLLNPMKFGPDKGFILRNGPSGFSVKPAAKLVAKVIQQQREWMCLICLMSPGGQWPVWWCLPPLSDVRASVITVLSLSMVNGKCQSANWITFGHIHQYIQKIYS